MTLLELALALIALGASGAGLALIGRGPDRIAIRVRTGNRRRR